MHACCFSLVNTGICDLNTILVEVEKKRTFVASFKSDQDLAWTCDVCLYTSIRKAFVPIYIIHLWIWIWVVIEATYVRGKGGP
jgi:hypothetical protein